MHDVDARSCPYCGARKMSGTVMETKTSTDGYLIRYRKCHKCNVTYKTFEIHADEFALGRGVYELAMKYVRDNEQMEQEGDRA